MPFENDKLKMCVSGLEISLAVQLHTPKFSLNDEFCMALCDVSAFSSLEQAKQECLLI